MSNGRIILWFRNDLRLHDSAVLGRALTLARQPGTDQPLASAVTCSPWSTCNSFWLRH